MEALSLYELNGLVRGCLENCFGQPLWLQAELSEVRVASNGHCYIEFVQKDTHGQGFVAKARGTVWANVFRILRPYFEQATGQTFTAGIKVLVQVEVTFHELYGYSLTVTDIDPSYTLGDMARRRREIVQQLEADGVLTLNKELPTPLLPQRVAVISSATAAGYGDFCDQLLHNAAGYGFHVELFTAWMQGDRVEASFLSALDAINRRLSEFDVVVIIRGGGATSDLSCFDTYLLAAACAQFPLPIVTGIGHERDDTVIDMVAHTRVKTPTAAAQWLIARMDETADRLTHLKQRLTDGVARALTRQHSQLQLMQSRLPVSVLKRLQSEHARLDALTRGIPSSSVRRMTQTRMELIRQQSRLQQSVARLMAEQRHRLALYRQQIESASPRRLLERGYSLTLKDGKPVKDATALQPGDTIETVLMKGRIQSTVNP